VQVVKSSSQKEKERNDCCMKRMMVLNCATMSLITVRHCRQTNWFTKASRVSCSNKCDEQGGLIVRSGRNVTFSAILPFHFNYSTGVRSRYVQYALPGHFATKASFGITSIYYKKKSISIIRDNVTNCSSLIANSRILKTKIYNPKNFPTKQIQLVCSSLHHHYRSFSTLNDKEKNKNELSSSKPITTTSDDDASTPSIQINPLISDFTQYLVDDEKEEKRSSAAAARRRNRSSAVMFGLEKEREMVEHVRKVSYTQKEQNRVRTAKNVNRALMGNVIICAGMYSLSEILLQFLSTNSSFVNSEWY
jgi:hypothetical protein